MRVYCGFCGADNASRARFCRACRKLIALPGGSTTAPAADRACWPGTAWPAEREAGDVHSSLGAARPGEPTPWPAPPSADPDPRWLQLGALLPMPLPPSRRAAPPAPLVPPTLVPPVLTPLAGPVEYLIDPHTGFPYDPRSLAPALVFHDSPAAAFFPRVGALLVDYCILSVLWFCLVGAAALVDSAALGLLATFLGPALYFIAFWSTGGRTPGYRAAGLRLLRTDGSPVGVRAGVVRYLGTLLSLPLFFLGYLWMLWDPAGQTWHDKLADTIVVRS